LPKKIIDLIIVATGNCKSIVGLRVIIKKWVVFCTLIPKQNILLKFIPKVVQAKIILKE